MGAGRYVFGGLIKVLLHCPGIGLRQDERYARIPSRTDGAKHVGTFVTLIDGLTKNGCVRQWAKRGTRPRDTIARMLHAPLGFSHITARPKHPKQKKGAIADFKKNSRASSKGR